MLFVAGNDGSFASKDCFLTDRDILEIEINFRSYNELKNELNDSLAVMRGTLSILGMFTKRTLSKRTKKMSNKKLIDWFQNIDMLGDSSEFLLQDVDLLLNEKYYKRVLRKAIRSCLHRCN